MAAGPVRVRPLARRQDGWAPRRPPLAPSTSAAWLGRALGFVAAAQRHLVPSASERPPTSTSAWRTPRSCSTPSPASEAAAATRRHVVAVSRCSWGARPGSAVRRQGRQVRLQPLQACEASRGGSPAAPGGSACAAPPGARAGGSGAGRGGGSGVARVCRHHVESRKQKSLGLLCSK